MLSSDTSNHVDNTSNLISANLNLAIFDTSNHVDNTSNLISTNLNNAIIDTSNHVDTTSNLISANLNLAIFDTSNHVDTTSNLISANLNLAIFDTSNHVDVTSNLISNRISELETDFISEEAHSSNRFIVNHIYNDDLVVNGNLTINSNLIVLGERTELETDVYTTEQLDVENTGSGIAFSLKQNDMIYDIFNVSNSLEQVFTITNDGSVGIGVTNPNNNNNKLDVNGNINIVSNENNFIYTIDGRDIILETSNYIAYTSNLISTNLNNAIIDTSNHVDNTSNLISANLKSYAII